MMSEKEIQEIKNKIDEMMNENKIQEIKNKIDETSVRVDEIDKKIMAFELFDSLYEQISELKNYVCFDEDQKNPIITISKKEVLEILVDYFLGEKDE